MQAENGMDIELLAQTAHAAYQSAGGVGGRDWPNELVDVRDNWHNVAGQAILTIQAAEELPFRQLAAKLFEVWHKTDGTTGQQYESLLPLEQLHWEAVARHLANLIDSDGSVKPSEHENRWGKWVRDKFNKILEIA